MASFSIGVTDQEELEHRVWQPIIGAAPMSELEVGASVLALALARCYLSVDAADAVVVAASTCVREPD